MKSILIPVKVLVFYIALILSSDPAAALPSEAIYLGESNSLELTENKTCPSPEDVKSLCAMLAELPYSAVCQGLLPAYGCYVNLKGQDFCKDACEDQKGLKNKLCLKACNNYVTQSPGPYDVLAAKFLNEACSSIENSVSEVVSDICDSILIKKDVAIDEAIQ